VYEDAEDGNTLGWSVYDNSPPRATITNVLDTQKGSRVIQLSGSGTKNGYALRKADNSLWKNTTQFRIQWEMKYGEDFFLLIDLQTSAGHRYLQYQPVNGNALGTGESVSYGIGTGARDGQWHTYARDLRADLQAAQPGVNILEVNGFLISGSGSVDNILLY